MNEKIPFKKDIIFKSAIGEITDISLTHDYSIKEDVVEGVFYLSGKYKMTQASVIEEEFFYDIPFSIALGQRIDKSTINIKIDSFNYKIKDDVLSVDMTLNMEFENMEERKEESITIDDADIVESVIEAEDESKNDDGVLESDDNVILSESDLEDVNIINSENIITNEETNNILDFTKNNIGDNYAAYKVVMMRNDFTIEDILNKYNITLDELKLVNDMDNVTVGDNIIIPIIKNE